MKIWVPDAAARAARPASRSYYAKATFTKATCLFDEYGKECTRVDLFSEKVDIFVKKISY